MDTDPEIVEVAKKICTEEGFKLEKEIGGGSFKKVYKICFKRESYALKIIKSPSFSPRIEREINAILKCNHPNISKIIKHGKIDFKKNIFNYIIEEYLGGGCLSDIIKLNKPITHKKIFSLGEKLILTLEHLESKKLIHRDIKPDNIMFRENSFEPVLVDFSIVRDLSEITLTQSWLTHGPGTPIFSSPEQLNNQKKLIDWRTDQFSLGVVISFVLINSHPYQNNNSSPISGETVDNIITRNRNQSIIDNLRAIGFDCLDKMTKPWPVERLRSPNELYQNWLKQKVS